MIVVLLCGHDGQHLIPVEGNQNFYYRCPKFFSKYRAENEKPCNMRMSIKRGDIIKKEILMKYANDELKKGKTYICGHISYKVIRITNKAITVYVRREDK